MKSKWMNSSRTKHVTTDEIAFYLARGVELHPFLHEEFIERIMEQERKSFVCALPITRLQHYNSIITRKINTLLKTA